MGKPSFSQPCFNALSRPLPSTRNVKRTGRLMLRPKMGTPSISNVGREPLPSSNSKSSSCAREQKRIQACLRERTRVKATAEAFRKLRDRLPRHAAEYQLTQMETLCRSMEYIRYLERQRDDIPTKPVLVVEHSKRNISLPHDLVEKKIPFHSAITSPRNEVCETGKEFGMTSSLSLSSLSSSSSSSSSAAFLSSADGESFFPQSGVRGIIPAARVICNQNLRDGSVCIAEAFESLRAALPTDLGERKLSQGQALHQAIEYIKLLRRQLQESTDSARAC